MFCHWNVAVACLPWQIKQKFPIYSFVAPTFDLDKWHLILSLHEAQKSLNDGWLFFFLLVSHEFLKWIQCLAVLIKKRYSEFERTPDITRGSVSPTLQCYYHTVWIQFSPIPSVLEWAEISGIQAGNCVASQERHHQIRRDHHGNFHVLALKLNVISLTMHMFVTEMLLTSASGGGFH